MHPPAHPYYASFPCCLEGSWPAYDEMVIGRVHEWVWCSQTAWEPGLNFVNALLNTKRATLIMRPNINSDTRTMTVTPTYACRVNIMVAPTILLCEHAQIFVGHTHKYMRGARTAFK